METYLIIGIVIIVVCLGSCIGVMIHTAITTRKK